MNKCNSSLRDEHSFPTSTLLYSLSFMVFTVHNMCLCFVTYTLHYILKVASHEEWKEDILLSITLKCSNDVNILDRQCYSNNITRHLLPRLPSLIHLVQTLIKSNMVAVRMSDQSLENTSVISF
jgi:hypothetical protein